VRAGTAFANAFLVAFLLDAALTVLDGVTSLFGSAPLTGPRNAVASIVFWCAPLVLVLALFSSRLPKRALLPLALGTWWLNLGALPLGPMLHGPLLQDVGLGSLQASLALPALVWIRRSSGGAAWLFREAFLPPVKPRRRAVLVLILLGLPMLGALLLAVVAVLSIERATGGFVRFASSGLTLDERHYRREGREVLLIGMSHVGRRGVYDGLLRQADRTPTVVLEEGVTDTKGLLPRVDHLAPVAVELGLDLQPRAAEMIGAPTAEDAVAAIEIEHADLDVSTFRPSTLEFLGPSLRLMADPRDAIALRALQDLMAAPEWRSIYAGVMEDLLTKRNDLLLDHIDTALAHYERVVVPWGVLHLPGIEAGLLARRFELASRAPRSFLPYRELARVVTRMDEP